MTSHRLGVRNRGLFLALALVLSACTATDPAAPSSTGNTGPATSSGSSSSAGTAGAATAASPSGAAGSTDRDQPPPGTADLVNDAAYAHGSWSWGVADLATGRTLYAKGENTLNFLGSTTKLFTVGTYYDTIGPDATLQTPVYAMGKRSGSTLDGNLVLVGSGDFILGGRGVLDGKLEFTEPDHVYAYASPLAKPVAADPLAGLDRLATQVAAAGIRSIQGDVLVDDRLFDPYPTKEGDLTPIMVNDNLLDVLVTPGAQPGEPAVVRTIPQTKYFTIVNKAVTGASGSAATTASTLGADRTVTITGTIPAGSTQLDLAVFAPDPTEYARALFVEALQRKGITVKAGLAAPTAALPAERTYPDTDKVASLTSPPASVLATLVSKISHNRGAETLMCLLAAHRGSRTCDDGLKAMLAELDKAGIPRNAVLIYDGEGSDPCSATPAAMLSWLTWARKQPWGEEFRKGLPDVAHDGTIMTKSGLSARPENGSMPALFVAAGQAGYITTAGGKELAVAVYALNATYPSVAEGLTKDLPTTESFLKQLRDHN